MPFSFFVSIDKICNFISFYGFLIISNKFFFFFWLYISNKLPLIYLLYSIFATFNFSTSPYFFQFISDLKKSKFIYPSSMAYYAYYIIIIYLCIYTRSTFFFLHDIKLYSYFNLNLHFLKLSQKNNVYVSYGLSISRYNFQSP